MLKLCQGDRIHEPAVGLYADLTVMENIQFMDIYGVLVKGEKSTSSSLAFSNQPHSSVAWPGICPGRKLGLPAP